jgi:hypothetical protein
MNEAYGKLFGKIIEDLGNLKDRGGNYCMAISTNGDDDIIDSNYHVKFRKSRFLGGQRLQRDLIKKYKPLGIFVGNPTKQEDKMWIIEFSFSRNKAKSNTPKQKERARFAQSV